MTDWIKIKNEYISTKISTRLLAEKHGISVSTLMKRSAAEGWGAEKKKQGSKIEAKVKQKTASQIASREADRITRILALGDTLLTKAECAVAELGEKYIVKRKETRIETDAQGKPIEVDETMEIAKPGKSVIIPLHVKQLASAMKDLRDVALTGKTDQAAMDKVDKLLEEITHAAAKP